MAFLRKQISMIQIIKRSIKEIESYRIAYLETLPKFQDIFLEFLVNDSNCFELQFENTTIGYTIVAEDHTLIELYLEPEYMANSSDYFIEIIRELQIKSIYCKSFDDLLLDCCLTNALPYKVIGCLYRDIEDVGIPISTDLTFRYAEESDLPFLRQQADEVFEPKELLDIFIQNKGIVFYQIADKTIGCGFLTQIHPKFNYYDIGVWVDSAYRQKGYAIQIVSHLKDFCFKNSRIPVLGCSIENHASQNMLKRCGMVSKYKLIEFDLNIKTN